MDEIEKIRQVQMKRATANFVRDMFLFSTFTGIAQADMVNRRHDHIHRQDDGSLWITPKGLSQKSVFILANDCHRDPRSGKQSRPRSSPGSLHPSGSR
ncbi:MAG: hypothetical protein LBP56_05610 [Odoribacteraceae bacterium]|nr:hypothetical protein [Odoribacteraceae bacterium]